MRISRFAPLLTPAALLAAALPSSAGDDDVAFARALAQRGYSDVAERVLRRAEASASTTPARRAETRLALAQLKRFEALRASRARGSGRPSAEAALRLFSDAEALYRALSEDRAAGRAARGELARLLTSHAEFASAAGGTEPVAALLDEALRLVADAETASGGDDECASLRLVRIEALHAKGAAAAQGDRTAAAALSRALDEIEKFTWDYAGTLRCAWAFRWRGLVLARLGRTREACESLRDAATAVTERDGIRGSDELALAAFEDLARVAALARGADADAIVGEAVATLDRLEIDWPRHLELAAGRRARLASAQLHARARDRARAVAGARAALVAAGDEDPDAAGVACGLIADWTGADGAATGLDPEVLARIARSAAHGGDLVRTVRACRAVISACVTPESRERFGWDAWETMGRAYGAAARWHEAFLAFDRIEEAWRRDPSNPRLAEITESTAYYRADALSRLAAESADDEDRAAAERAMSEFARDHPGSGFASGAREQQAFRALSEASALRRNGDRDAALARGREALAALTAIGEESAMFDRAQALVAEAHRQLGDADRAVRLAQEWLDAARPEPSGAGAKRSRSLARTQALVTLFTAMADRAAGVADAEARAAAFRGVLGALALRGDEFLVLAPKGRDQFDAWRAEALLGAGDVEAAEALILAQIASRPSHSGTRYLAAAAARADESAAAAAPSPEKARGLALRAARLWEFVLEASGQPDAETARSAGLAFLAGGDLPHAADLLSLAASHLRRDAERAPDLAERARLADRARGLSVELARSLVALLRFDEARSEIESVLARDDDAGAVALARLAAGETLRDADVEWLVRRAARNRSAVDVLAAALAGSGTREHLAAAAQAVAALRYTLARDAGPTAESVDLAIRHADAMLRLGGAGGPREASSAAAALLDDAFGSDEALAQAESLVPGARARIEDLLRRAEAESGGR